MRRSSTSRTTCRTCTSPPSPSSRGPRRPSPTSWRWSTPSSTWSRATARRSASSPSSWAGRSGSTTPTSTSSTTCATPRCRRPGGESELRKLVGRVMAQQLDRSKPLWEIWVVEGLEDGRWAMLAKTHHALVDGVSGTDLLAVIMDLSPDAERPEHLVRVGAPPGTVEPPARWSTRSRTSCARPTSSCGPPGPRPAWSAAWPATPWRSPAACSPWPAWCGPCRSPASTGRSGPHRRYAWATTSVDDIKRGAQGARRHVQRRRAGLHHQRLPRAAAVAGRGRRARGAHAGAGVGPAPRRLGQGRRATAPTRTRSRPCSPSSRSTSRTRSCACTPSPTR